VEVEETEAPPGRDAMVAALYHRHRSDLTRLAFGLVGDRDEAEEIVQDAYAGLLRRWSSLRDSDAGPAYLHAAVVNGARARWRRRKVRVLADATLRREPVSRQPDEIVEQSVVLAAVAQLPMRKRACVLLRYYADLSEADTAEALGVSVGTVKSQTAKALDQLARLLEPQAAQPMDQQQPQHSQRPEVTR
jgi:RNA polymerase sigma-70 factor (sigma-E family)